MYRFKEDLYENEERYRPSTLHTSAAHYFKFEHGGMLVYDSKAIRMQGKFTEQGIKHTPDQLKTLPSSIKKELESANIDGNINVEANYYVMMKEYTPAPSFPYDYILEIPNDSITLRFNSKFESGNLYKAVKLSDYEYQLYIHNDIGTYNQNHWYYFSVTNPRKTSITFKIVNIRKKDILYLSGMQPAVFSTKLSQETGTKWHRDGQSIGYTENIPSSSSNFTGRQKYYTLTFTYTFKYEDDEVFFAYAIPYTYSDLNKYLDILRTNYTDICKVYPLCNSIAGNVCYMMTITENVSEYFKVDKGRKKKDDKFGRRKGIVLMARVHSGETVSSYMMAGAIDYLVSSAAKGLRKGYVFNIVPMLNPDGVRYGNYRVSLLGVDLNRRWDSPHKVLHPTIYHAKKMIEDFKTRHQLMMVCDMHGHTKKKNVFIYGCSTNSAESADKQKNLLARVIPHHLSKKNSLFSFSDSHFRMEKSKESTARIVLFKEFDIIHSYTMEASFFGPSKAEYFNRAYDGDMHMSPEDLTTLGRDLCRCCSLFNSHRVYSKRVRQTNSFLRSQCLKTVHPRDETGKVAELDEGIVLEGASEELEDLGVIVKETVCDELDVVDVGADPESSGSDSEPSDTETKKQKSYKKVQKHSSTPVKIESMPSSRIPTSVKPLIVKKPQILEPDWTLRRAVRSPNTLVKPQETIPAQNFSFPLQTRFNQFSLDIKLKSEIPELETKKKTPKISKPEKKIPVIQTKTKNAELYLPALLNINLPDTQNSFKSVTKRKRRNEIFLDIPPREVFHIGLGGFNGSF